MALAIYFFICTNLPFHHTQHIFLYRDRHHNDHSWYIHLYRSHHNTYNDLFHYKKNSCAILFLMKLLCLKTDMIEYQDNILN